MCFQNIKGQQSVFIAHQDIKAQSELFMISTDQFVTEKYNECVLLTFDLLGLMKTLIPFSTDPLACN